MTTKVISAFPGTGKTYLVSVLEKEYKMLDLDSNAYTKGFTEEGKARNPKFPENYITAIKDAIGKVDILFVSCQPNVLTALREKGISFTLVYPERGLKNIYIERFLLRGSSKSFITLISNNWDPFLDFLEHQSDCEHIVLTSNQYISDVIDSF